MLSFGRDLIDYDSDYDGGVMAYDLDSPHFTSTLVYKDTSIEHDMRKIFAQVDGSQILSTCMLGIVFKGFSNSRKFFHSHRHLNVASNIPQKHLLVSTFLESNKFAVVMRLHLSHPKSKLSAARALAKFRFAQVCLSG
jgi:hypothetical protein